MNNIYQQIWNSDAARSWGFPSLATASRSDRHKFSVSPRDSSGKWLDPHADLLLDEQIKAFGRVDLDLAKHPLFYYVNRQKFEYTPSYQSLLDLFDNYRFDNRQSEIVTRGEKIEIDRFIDDICQTEPIEIAYQYVTQKLKFNLERRVFKTELKRIWFSLYTNYFGEPLRDTSGFEHIFVGEGKYNYFTGDPKIVGSISGYHSWIKFYLDERKNRANYLGHNYTVEGNLGVDNPYVVTVQMRWQDRHKQKNIAIELFKKRGCFFVGTSPECEMAMGTVAFYESLANYKFQDEKRAITINGANYHLALYRNIKADGTRGNFIRSFYPIYLGKKQKIDNN